METVTNNDSAGPEPGSDGGDRSAAGVLQRLCAVIMLGGTVRPTQLTAAIGRSVLDLPIDDEQSVVSAWGGHLEGLVGMLGRAELPIRLLVDEKSALPSSLPVMRDAAISVERDPAAFRGTAGLLRDVVQRYDQSDYVLVLNAAQVMLQPVAGLVERLAELGGDVCMAAHRTGVPTGTMLLRCGCLAEVPEIGFVDLKEQALPEIARTFRVKVLDEPEPTGLPVRTLGDYLAALRWYHLRRVDDQTRDRLFREEWQSVFSIVEEGAQVEPEATMHDSVVLRGGRVESRAVLVRSLVGPGVTARKGRVILDEVAGKRSGRAESKG